MFIEHGKTFLYNFPDKIDTDNAQIQFYYKSSEMQSINEDAGSLKKKDIGSVQIKDVIINSVNTILNQINKVNNKVEKINFIIKMKSLDNKEITITLNPASNWSNCLFTSGVLNNINSIEFVNNSLIDYFLDNIKIINEQKQEKEYKNIVQKPKDAVMKVDGVEVKRDRNNNINDVIKGVNLNLLNATKAPVELNIKEDSELITKKVNDFINQYNNVITYILEAGKNSKVNKPKTAENEEMIENEKQDQGILSNDLELINLHSKLRSTVVESYPTSLGDKLSIINQLGISTGKWGSSWENIHKGLLELDPEQFNSMINLYGEKIGELFGYSSDKNKIIDAGLAYKMDKVLEPFIQGKGLIDGKVSLANLIIDGKNKEIKEKNDYLALYEATLKKKFGKMERSLQTLQGNQAALENQMKNLPSKSGE